LGLDNGVEGGGSDFLTSFGAVFATAPNGFAKSGAALGGRVVAEFGDAGTGPVEGELELDENFELILDIHEFRLLGGPPF